MYRNAPDRKNEKTTSFSIILNMDQTILKKENHTFSTDKTTYIIIIRIRLAVAKKPRETHEIRRSNGLS